ncbi:MAG: hypothetical protein A3B81_04415 [Candidatus Muproteobacteria bacterium RIFCSPHIGHO2_02_FULL_65_16]|uniref:Solute-binding protein family 3/N-terminal domain-containing protein n=1 Tax=Candidatus Muproteobacteria bacterium RIFCSPHIGHO2_02_FULL_65_16 TaxID=1817766 RepID=A0A1F6TYY9_9PROT|nr:MAG: hypothetical protein A3B81_04415 [Candidatus Muproteobacteria bacterium RIFCSPHIGHO2_02_FULL_65_16]
MRKTIFCGVATWCFLLSAIAAAASAAAPGAARERSYILAVVPYQLPLTVHKEWSPLAERLAQRLGARVELKLYRAIPHFEEALARGEPDLAFMNPYHLIMTRKTQGYIPLVRSGQALSGILVVRRDSPIKTVADLNGKTIGFPAPNAFASSLYLRALLTEKLKIRFAPVYLDTHNEVYRHVIMGEVDAGGGIPHTLKYELAAAREQLRVVYTTPGFPPHPLAVHPRVPAAVRRAVLKAILDMNADEPGMKLLERAQLTDPTAASYQGDYRPLEKLGLEKYVVNSR